MFRTDLVIVLSLKECDSYSCRNGNSWSSYSFVLLLLGIPGSQLV